MVQWICTKFVDSTPNGSRLVHMFNYVQRGAGLHLPEPNV